MSQIPLLEARDLHFHYEAGTPVICGASLALEPGSLSAIIGSNGCGKSTLIRLLAGVLVPKRGEIRFQGARLQALPRRERARRIAYVPQSIALAFPFTAMEVVLTGRTPYSSRLRFENAADRRKALEALEAVGASHLAARPVTELSGGERQIVALARALAQEPACLLLDEPSAALDLKHRAAFVRTLARLRDRQGLTVLVVTHDLNLVEPLFDHIFAIRCGQVFASGKPAEVLNHALLSAIYDDPDIRTRRLEDRTLIWSEAG
ncbi:MAG TPA: ABC transporter ATP-binding protein [Bryobacteraceae bacterium]|nr:ABC transporter ATP-binding protein [Bryobacteraceae bacterium]